MASKVFLHVGLMKTGTSLLQANLFANRDALATRGVLIPGESWSDQVFAATDVLDRKNASRGIRRGAWDTLVEEIAAWPGAAVISMEFFGPAGPRKVAKVLASFPGVDVEVVVTARDLNSTLPSMWQETLKNSRHWSWPEYLDGVRDGVGPGELFWRQQDLAQVVTTWSEGGAAVTLVTVPPRGAQPDLLWHRFCEALAIDPVGLVTQPSANASLGLESSLALQRLNAALAERELPPSDFSRLVKHGLAKSVMAERAGRESRLGLSVPSWLEARWEQIRALLVEREVRVVGDLSDLVPRDVPGVGVDDIDDAAVLDAAVDALAGALLSRRKKDDRPEPPRTRRIGLGRGRR